MNFLDILIALPMGYLIYKGFRRGIIFETAALAGILVGCWAAIKFSEWLAELLPFKGEYTVLIAFFILFIGVILLSLFLGKCLEGVVKLVHVGAMNKILGAVLGWAKAVCIIAVIIDFVLIVDVDQIFLTPPAQENSLLFKPVHKVGMKMTGELKIYAENLREERLERKNNELADCED